MRVSLIITAAGSSSRFSKTLPQAKKAKTSFGSKLFFELGGKPVLERTLMAFSKIPGIHEVFVTVPPGFEREAAQWGKSRSFKNIQWLAGGKTRAESVLLALKKTSPRNEFVMVHDGARPLIRPKTIQKLILQAKKYDAVLLARQVVPTLKKMTASKKQVEQTIDRSQLAEAETPQIVKRKILLEAYRSVPNALSFTDETSLAEALGSKTGIFLHTDWNPKLTHYSDYELAEAQLNSKAEFRIGKGYDIHRLVPGRKLWIGGLKIPFEKGSLGHSDGDALLHSITDAILGALSLGDLGDWFSDQKRQYKNIASDKLLAQVLKKVKELGWQVAQIDTNVILEKPKLGLFKIKIRSSLAKMLELPLSQVSVKARTYEGLPPFGTSEAWACEAVVMVRKINRMDSL